MGSAWWLGTSPPSGLSGELGRGLTPYVGTSEATYGVLMETLGAPGGVTAVKNRGHWPFGKDLHSGRKVGTAGKNTAQECARHHVLA